MIKEAYDYEKRNHWEVVHCLEEPTGVKNILAIWAFRHKRFPNVRIN